MPTGWLAMASLTSARPRRGVAAAGGGQQQQQGSASPAADHSESFQHGGPVATRDTPSNDNATTNGIEMHFRDDSKGHDKYSYASRPFGSTTPLSNGYHATNAATSGWVTSEAYVDKGKGKPSASGHHGKTGNGPLRDYGGGLGVVGQGEFKLLLAVTALASVVRLWRIDRPASVVFDEVHFGGALISAGWDLTRLMICIQRLRDQIHQKPLLHGCASSASKAPHHLCSLVRRLPWRL